MEAYFSCSETGGQVKKRRGARAPRRQCTNPRRQRRGPSQELPEGRRHVQGVDRAKDGNTDGTGSEAAEQGEGEGGLFNHGAEGGGRHPQGPAPNPGSLGDSLVPRQHRQDLHGEDLCRARPLQSTTSVQDCGGELTVKPVPSGEGSPL